MFKLTTNAQKGLQDASNQNFYQGLADFFAQEEPDLFATLSNDQRLLFATACHRRATRYGLKQAASVYAWADVSILCGSHFDGDIFYGPVTETIKRASAFDEREVMSQAQSEVTAYLQTVRGPDNEHAVRALGQIRSFYDGVKSDTALSLGNEQRLVDYIVGLTADFYPELHAYHGSARVAEACTQSIARSRSYYNIRGDWHLCYMAIMAMSFGAGFDFDELYPWVQNVLIKTKDADPDRCVEKLASRSIVWLDKVLENGAEMT